MSSIIPKHRVCICGAGVAGLSSALAIYENATSPVEITVLAEHFPSEVNYPLTSDGAGALWELRTENHREFATATFRRYETLIATNKAVSAGVSLCNGIEWIKPSNVTREFLAKDLIHDFQLVTQDEVRDASLRLGREFVAGWRYTSFIVDSPTYMKYLMTSLTNYGCNFIKTRVHSLESLRSKYDGVVNASGYGARVLTPDENVFPIRGQTLVVTAPLITKWQVADSETDLTYILPRLTSGLVVCGGTYEEKSDDLLPNKETRDGIIERCSKLCPDLLSKHICLDESPDWVGLRPARIGDVRCELGEDGVIHNYGHSGCGHSLHWGCALKVADLVWSKLMK